MVDLAVDLTNSICLICFRYRFIMITIYVVLFAVHVHCTWCTYPLFWNYDVIGIVSCLFYFKIIRYGEISHSFCFIFNNASFRTTSGCFVSEKVYFEKLLTFFFSSLISLNERTNSLNSLKFQINILIEAKKTAKKWNFILSD